MITTLTDPVDIAEAVSVQRARLRKAGMPERWATPGEAFCDQYIRVRRDAVRFPNGALGTYIVVENAAAAGCGVIIVPRLRGRYVVLRHWRHATGRVHLEFPRGRGNPGETPEDAARRELREETGVEAATLVPMGVLQPDAGLLNSPIHVFAADVEHAVASASREPIEGFELLTDADLMKLAAGGMLDDALTLSALMIEQARRFQAAPEMLAAE